MTDPLEELQAETARKLVESLREELAVAREARDANYAAVLDLRSELAEANERVRQVQADYQYFVEKGENRERAGEATYCERLACTRIGRYPAGLCPEHAVAMEVCPGSRTLTIEEIVAVRALIQERAVWPVGTGDVGVPKAEDTVRASLACRAAVKGGGKP